MKKVLLVCLAVLLLGAGSAFAEGLTIDIAGVYGTEPSDSELGGAFGGRIGASYDLESVMPNLQARADLTYLKYSDELDFGIAKVDISYTRIPIFLGARYAMPMEPVTLFGELGIEISMDEAEAGTTVLGTVITASASETHFGITPGVGVAYNASEAVSVGANVRYHAITDPYISAGVFVGYKIPM